MKTIVRAAPGTSRRPLLLFTALAASLVLGACDSTDAPLAPDLPTASPARAKGLPTNGPIYFGAQLNYNGDIFAINPDGTGLRRLTYDPAVDMMPDVSRDGRKVVFVSARTGTWDIYSMNADGSNLHRLTTMLADDQTMPGWPRWSPDGKRIAYERTLPGETRSRIFVMGASGSSPRPLTDGAENARQPAWSPDGARIAYAMTSNGIYQLFVSSADGSGAKPITSCDAGDSCENPTWSPDGTLIAYRGWPTLRSVTPDGLPAFTFPEAGANPVFSPDGTKLVYTNLASQTVRVLELNGQKVTELLDVSWNTAGFSWSR